MSRHGALDMSKDYARSLDKIHHKILQDLVKLPENSFCADCAMRGRLRTAPPCALSPRMCSGVSDLMSSSAPVPTECRWVVAQIRPGPAPILVCISA